MPGPASFMTVPMHFMQPARMEKAGQRIRSFDVGAVFDQEAERSLVAYKRGSRQWGGAVLSRYGRLRSIGPREA